MGRADRYLGLQRMVTNGDVIYVYQPPASAVAPPAAPAEAKAKEPVVAATEAEAGGGTEAGGETETGLEYWDWESGDYTPAPPGYGYEFGSMRLVPVRPDRDAPE